MREAAEALSRAAGTLSPRSNDHRAPRAPTGKELGETRETHLGGQPRHNHRLEGRRRATPGVVPQSPSQPRRHLRWHPHARDGHQRSGRMRQNLDARRPCLRALRDLPPRSGKSEPHDPNRPTHPSQLTQISPSRACLPRPRSRVTIRRSLAGRFSLLGVGSFGGLGAVVLPLRWCSGGPVCCWAPGASWSSPDHGAPNYSGPYFPIFGVHSPASGPHFPIPARYKRSLSQRKPPQTIVINRQTHAGHILHAAMVCRSSGPRYNATNSYARIGMRVGLAGV